MKSAIKIHLLHHRNDHELELAKAARRVTIELITAGGFLLLKVRQHLKGIKRERGGNNQRVPLTYFLEAGARPTNGDVAYLFSSPVPLASSSSSRTAGPNRSKKLSTSLTYVGLNGSSDKSNSSALFWAFKSWLWRRNPKSFIFLSLFLDLFQSFTL